MSIHQFMYGCDAVRAANSPGQYVCCAAKGDETSSHTEHIFFPVTRSPEQEQSCKPAGDTAEDHGPDHHALSTINKSILIGGEGG